MIEASLKELIEFGHLGPLRLGMKRERVETLLGAPDDWGAAGRQYSQATILKYGDVELHFDAPDGGLWLIHLEEFDSPSGGKSLKLDPWVIRPSLTLSEMEECLSHGGIRYEVTDQAGGNDYKCMVAGAGAKLIFEGGRLFLSALSHSRRRAT